jgi:sugar/nucleoside kinase (ribokinase family)
MNPANSRTPIGKHVITSLGKRGVIWVSGQGIAKHVPAISIRKEYLNANGAGDTLMASLASHIIKKGCLDLSAIEDGVRAAADHIIAKHHN